MLTPEKDGKRLPLTDTAGKSPAAITVEEILARDTEDESLVKYKQALLGSAAFGDRGNISDPRRLVIDEFRVVFAPEDNTPDIVHSFTTLEGLKRLETEGVVMKEGARFKLRIIFRVQHEIIVGVKFVNNTASLLMNETEDLTLGSYPPGSTAHVFEFPKWDYSEAPKGIMYRGTYKVVNYFVDSEHNKHLEFKYELKIVKDR